jgi:hypothetical protein
MGNFGSSISKEQVVEIAKAPTTYAPPLGEYCRPCSLNEGP